MKTHRLKRVLVVLFVVALSSSLARAQNEDGVVVLSDTVTGNQEQPKVLYIVPWKPANDDTILYQPLRTKLEQTIFDHVERPEHQRQVQFLEQLRNPRSLATPAE